MESLNATSFAIGLPFLAMMISSPAAALSTSDDSCVFASYKFSVMETTLPSSPGLVKLVNHSDVLKHAHVQAALPRPVAHPADRLPRLCATVSVAAEGSDL